MKPFRLFGAACLAATLALSACGSEESKSDAKAESTKDVEKTTTTEKGEGAGAAASGDRDPADVIASLETDNGELVSVIGDEGVQCLADNAVELADDDLYASLIATEGEIDPKYVDDLENIYEGCIDDDQFRAVMAAGFATEMESFGLSADLGDCAADAILETAGSGARASAELGTDDGTLAMDAIGGCVSSDDIASVVAAGLEGSGITEPLLSCVADAVATSGEPADVFTSLMNDDPEFGAQIQELASTCAAELGVPMG